MRAEASGSGSEAAAVDVQLATNPFHGGCHTIVLFFGGNPEIGGFRLSCRARELAVLGWPRRLDDAKADGSGSGSGSGSIGREASMNEAMREQARVGKTLVPIGLGIFLGVYGLAWAAWWGGI